MGAGKVLILIGALLTLVSTFFFAFFETASPDVYAYGLGFVLNLPDLFSDADPFAVIMGVEVMVVYILAIVYIVFLISGILQLVGLASRVVAIIGSILPILGGVLILLINLEIVDMLSDTALFWREPIVDGVLPFNLAIGPTSLGTITLLAGGVLGLAGGIMGTSD
ncbi:hypothetical protein LCGC14_0832800 [marine sediment metagenome]|uniref:Uncharacterized protein n=1 Tax=marine sediment metagenome TaxID=412755 RepID=A0A0F9PFF9_9ZZZZ|nr:hypothetical protein [archaeon]